MDEIRPYQNESETLQIGELTIENRLDRIALYGNLELTRDRAGLAHARQLKQLLDATVRELEAAPLPEHIDTRPPDEVPNPFL